LSIGVYSVLIARLEIVAGIEDIRKDSELLREGFLGVLFEKTAHCNKSK